MQGPGHAKPNLGKVISSLPPHLQSVKEGACKPTPLRRSQLLKFLEEGVPQVILCLLFLPCSNQGIKALRVVLLVAGQAPRNQTTRNRKTNRHMARTTPLSIYASHTPFSSELGA